MCSRPQGPKVYRRLPHTPKSTPPPPRPRPPSGPHNHYQVEGSISLHLLFSLPSINREVRVICRGDLTHDLTPSINTGRRKGAETILWSGNGAVLLAVGYVTHYHYNSILRALPRHLAHVRTWNRIHLCGSSSKGPVCEGSGQKQHTVQVNLKSAYMWK